MAETNDNVTDPKTRTRMPSWSGNPEKLAEYVAGLPLRSLKAFATALISQDPDVAERVGELLNAK